MQSRINDRYFSHDNTRLVQGDILSEIPFFEFDDIGGADGELQKITFPFVVVLTQDCDLEQDYANRKDEKDRPNTDKFINSVLLVPAWTSEDVRSGAHLKDLGLKMVEYPSRKLWDPIIKNNVPRYHHLERSTKYGIPDLVMDFKHFYTLPRSYLLSLYEGNYLCTLSELFREDVSHRFAAYLSRIGLPELSSSTSSEQKIEG